MRMILVSPGVFGTYHISLSIDAVLKSTWSSHGLTLWNQMHQRNLFRNHFFRYSLQFCLGQEFPNLQVFSLKKNSKHCRVEQFNEEFVIRQGIKEKKSLPCVKSVATRTNDNASWGTDSDANGCCFRVGLCIISLHNTTSPRLCVWFWIISFLWFQTHFI